MNLIVVVDRKWGIGNKGKLLARLPKDQKFFREKTINKVVVMGRKTYESFPSKQPLKDRRNIVLTRNRAFSPEGVETAHSKEEILKILKDNDLNDVFIIGGEEIYRLFLKECDKAIITKIDGSFDADAHFPNLDMDPNWERVNKSETINDNGYDISFNEYIRI